MIQVDLCIFWSSGWCKNNHYLVSHLLAYLITNRAGEEDLGHLDITSQDPGPTSGRSSRRSIKHGNAAPPECGPADIVRRWRFASTLWESGEHGGLKPMTINRNDVCLPTWMVNFDEIV